VARWLNRSTIETLLRYLALGGGIGLLWLLVMTVAAVVMRKVFGSPLLGVFDLSQVTMIVIVFSGMAYCAIKRGHVAVELFNDMLPPRLQTLLNAAINLVSAALLGFIAWKTTLKAFEAIEDNEATMMIFIPHFPFILFAALGFALHAVACLMLVFDRTQDHRGSAE
jgi:TRAP-type C4-dicarboxylate transport system permease small subunit